jgi:hypothetical protein
MSKKKILNSYVLAIGIIIAGIVVTGLSNIDRIWRWYAILGFLIAFIFIIGHGITGHYYGAFIDERNMISLSKFQELVWTVIFLSAFLTMVLDLFQNQNQQDFKIVFDQSLLFLLGISSASFIGSPLIKNNGFNQEPDQNELEKTLMLLNKGADNLQVEKKDNKGLYIINKDPKDASWTDLFKGEETGNGFYLDISKIQMFLFTIVTVLIYSVMLTRKFQGNCPVRVFPKMDENIIWLLAISHSSYLTHKAIPHSKKNQNIVH